MKRAVALLALTLVMLTGCRSYSPEPDASKEYARWLVCGDAIEDRHKALEQERTPDELAAEKQAICGEEPERP